jgi:hypothetical protein
LKAPNQEVLNQRNKNVERKKMPKIHPEKIFPWWMFWERTQFLSRVFELPLPRNAHAQSPKAVLFL